MKLSTSLVRPLLSGLAGLLGVIALMVISLSNEYQNANQHARVEVENISRLLEEQALTTVQTADLLLRDVLGDVHPDDMRLARGSNSPRAKELHTLLESHIKTVPELMSSLHLTNAKGEHIHSSLATLPHIDISDRYHFRRQRDDPNAGLVISPPVISRTTGKWTLILTRRINFADGSFAGTITAILDPEFFQKFYRSIDMGKQGVVSLYDMELHLVARYPQSEKNMGKVGNLHAKTYIEKGIKQATYHAKSGLDGVDRMYSFRQVGDLALFVFAGAATDDYLAGWRRHTWEYGIGLIMLSLLVAGFGRRQWQAEKALLKSELNLRTIADYTYDWEYWEGPQQELRYMSPSCERITGYSLPEFMADPELLYRIIHPDDRYSMEGHRENITHQDVGCTDFRIVRNDGEIRWISHGCQAVYGKDGQYLGRRASNRDITESKHAEEMLRKNRQLLDGIIENIPNMIFLKRASDLRFELCNRAAETLLGHHRDELFGHNDYDFFPKEQAGFFTSKDRAVLEQNNIVDIPEESIETPRGTRILHTKKLVLRDEKGQPQYLLGISEDITERKFFEQQRNQHNQHVRALMNAGGESSFLLAPDGAVLAINDTGLRRLRLTEEEVLGKNIFDLIPPEIASGRRAVFLEVVRSRKSVTVEDERAGIKFLVTYTPILDEAGEIVQVAVYGTDVTEKRQLEAIEKLLPAVNHKILVGAPLQEVLELVCQKTVEAFDLALAWAGKKMEDGSVALLAASGPAQDYLSALRQIGVRWDDTPLGHGPTGSAIRLGEEQYKRTDDVHFAPWAEAAAQQGIKSSIAVPLIMRGNIYGVFALYSKQETQFEPPAFRKRISMLADKICLSMEMAIEQEQVTLLSTAVTSASNAVMITDPNGRIEWVNPAFVMLSGYSSAELLGRTPSILKSGTQDAAYYQQLWQIIRDGKVWIRDTTEKRKDGTLYTVQQTITPILAENGKITHFVAIHEDVTAKLETQAHIQYIASHDALTGLPNRALFYDRLGQLCSLSKRTQTGMALMFIDLDGFKQVNDKLGHYFGDLLLKGVAERLLACVRDSDTVARLGGDEFTVTLYDIAGRERIVNVAEKILNELSRSFELEGQSVTISASIGIAIASAKRQTCDDKFVERADSAMYEAKRAGKSCYRFASEQ